jgi:hypothetical protein
MLPFVLLLLTALVGTSSARKEERLYVWGGGVQGDMLVTLDFTADSETYGEVLDVLPLIASSTVAASGNEPHHSGISRNQEWLLGAGLLSFLQGKDQIFVYQIDQETFLPSFSYSFNPDGGCADEFIPLGDTTFLLTMMCSKMAQSPGTVVWLDAATREVKNWMNAPGIKDFNPHGCGYREGWGLLTTDYIQPITLFNNPPMAIFRDTIRFFNPDGTLNATIVQPGSNNNGYMDVRFIPNDPQGRAMTSGTSTQLVYLIDPAKGTSKSVYDLRTLTHGITGLSSGYMPMRSDGKYVVMTYSMRYVTLCDISDPEHPFSTDLFDFCDPPLFSGAPDFSVQCDATGNVVGTHFALWHDDDRIFVVNYFLILGSFNYAGTGTVHVFKLSEDKKKLIYDTAFNPVLPMDHPHSGRIATFEVEDEPEPPAEPSASSILGVGLWLNLFLVLGRVLSF